MAEHCLTASHGYPPDLVLFPGQGISRVSKDFQQFLPTPGPRQDIIKPGDLILRLHQREEPWKSISGLLEDNQFVRTDLTVGTPVLIDVQETCPNSVLFGFGIAEHCTRHEKILKFLMSGSSEVERKGLALSILSYLMGRQALTLDIPQLPYPSDYIACVHDALFQPSFLCLSSIPSYSLKSFLDLAKDVARGSEITVHPDGKISLTSDGTEVKDILPTISEFCSSKYSTKCSTQSMLVPYFDRFARRRSRANTHGSSLHLETGKASPVQSPEKINLKPPAKKRSNRKAAKERNLCKKNYFHACESFLSIMVGKKRYGKTAILSLKKSGPELPQFLTQFSASIAGTGLAVLFSVICEVACSRVPFCAIKCLNAGLGFGLIWLSWAVDRLRDKIIYINKSTGKLATVEDQMMKTLDRSVNGIYFRAATLIAAAVLRIA